MLKIAVVTAHFPNPARPTDGRFAYQILRLLSRITDLRVFTPLIKYPRMFKRLSRGHGDVDASFTPPADVNVKYIDYLGVPFLSRPFNGFLAARAVLPDVKKFGPDLITSYCLYPDGFAALQVAKALSLPLVAKGVGSDVHSIPDWIAARHTRTLLREANLIAMVSEDLRVRAIKMGGAPEKILTVCNGCDTDVFRPMDKLAARAALHIEQDAEVVVYVGRMDVKKGLRELIEAAAALHPKRPRLRVYMVGEGPDKPIIDEAIQAHGAAAYVQTVPACAFDVVPVWNAASDLLTLPSYMEGNPNVILEAIASGRPVVATSVGGIPEIMGEEGGALVPPRDAAALAAALGSVLDKSWDAEAIASSRSRSWETVASELLTIYEKIVSEHKAGIHAR